LICDVSTNCRSWSSSIPYLELSGFWKPVSYFDGNSEIDQSKRKDKAGLYIYFFNDTLPEKLAWNDGCKYYGNRWTKDKKNENPPYFGNLGNGIIEIHDKGYGLIAKTLQYVVEPKPVNCNNTINEQWQAFMSNIHEKKLNTSITDDGQLLSLTKGDEKFVLRKIHNYAQPNFTTELFGTWLPFKGKLNSKMVEKFADDAEVVFDNGKINGAIKYKDGEGCDNDHDNLYFNYYYSDSNFISIASRSWPINYFIYATGQL